MNNARRAGSAKARGLIGQAKEIIAQAASEEREYFDDMPANLQGGDTGQRPTPTRPRSTKPMTASRKSSPHST
jgi:hypothetical protein